MSPDPPRTSGPSSPCKDDRAALWSQFQSHEQGWHDNDAVPEIAGPSPSAGTSVATLRRPGTPIPPPLPHWADKHRVELIWEADGPEAAQTLWGWGTLL